MVRLLPLPGVFQPHSDSWLLADRLVDESIGPQTSVLDLCTGSGVLALTAAERGARNVLAVDVAARAVIAVRVNAWLNGLAVTAVRGDLFSALDGQRFDLIVSNPPYVPGEELPSRGFARAWEAGPRGREFIDRICTEAPSHLNPGGVLLLVHSSLCGESETAEALARRGLRVSVVARTRGPLGRRLRARAQWLRQRGLLAGGEVEDIVLIRGQTTRA